MIDVIMDVPNSINIILHDSLKSHNGPQLDWSRISLIDGHFSARGSVRQSKSVGRSSETGCKTQQNTLLSMKADCERCGLHEFSDPLRMWSADD